MVCDFVGVNLAGILGCITSGVFSDSPFLFGVFVLFLIALMMFINNVPMRLALGLGVVLLFILTPINNEMFRPFLLLAILIMAWVIVGGFARAHKEQ